MNIRKQTGWLAAAGGLVILLAAVLRQSALQERARQAPPPAPAVDIPVSVPDPVDPAVARLHAEIARSPRDTRSRWQLVPRLQQSGDLAGAAEQLEEIARLEPQRTEARLAMATQYLSANRLSDAETAFRAVTERWPKSAAGWEGLAGVLFHQRRFLEASVAARRAVALEPKSPSHRAILGTSLMELALEFPNRSSFKQQLAEARHALEAILPTWSQKGEVTYRLGRICLTQRDYRGAIRYFTQAQALLPDRSAVAFSLATSYVALGDRATGRRTAGLALLRFPDEAALHDLLGSMIQRSKEPDAQLRSLQSYAEAVRLAPNVARYQERYGAACLRVNRLEEARQAFEKSIALNDHRAFPFQQLAVVYRRLGNPQKAHEAAKIASDIVHDDDQLKQVQNLSAIRPGDVRLHLILADRYRDLAMREPARDQYLMVLQLDPNNAQAAQGLAALQSRLR